MTYNCHLFDCCMKFLDAKHIILEGIRIVLRDSHCSLLILYVWFLSLKRHSRDIILYKHPSLLLAPRALRTASAFCDIYRGPVLSPLHRCINPLPYQYNHCSSGCTSCSDDQASAVSWSVLLSEKLIPRETSELDAHDVHCQRNGSFSVVDHARKPRCVECLRRAHAGLCEDDSTYVC